MSWAWSCSLHWGYIRSTYSSYCFCKWAKIFRKEFPAVQRTGISEVWSKDIFKPFGNQERKLCDADRYDVSQKWRNRSLQWGHFSDFLRFMFLNWRFSYSGSFWAVGPFQVWTEPMTSRSCVPLNTSAQNTWNTTWRVNFFRRNFSCDRSIRSAKNLPVPNHQWPQEKLSSAGSVGKQRYLDVRPRRHWSGSTYGWTRQPQLPLSHGIKWDFCRRRVRG